MVQLERSIAELIAQSAVEPRPDEPTKWTDDYLDYWSQLVRSQFHLLTDLLRHYFPSLPLPPTPPADIGFFLARNLSLSLTRDSHRRKFALSYGKFSAWESVELSGDGAPAALPIPYIEANTPIRWPLLLHELGHHLIPATDNIRAAGRDVVSTHIKEFSDVAAKQRALQEAVADRVAESACGKAYALALIREAHIGSYLTHRIAPAVSTVHRLRMLDAWTDLESIVPDEWLKTMDSGVEDLASSIEFLTEARQRAIELVPTRPESLPRQPFVERAIRQLATGEPAGSVMVGQRNGRRGDVPLSSVRRLSPSQIDSYFQSAIELPCRDSEILEAAWTLEALREPQEYLEILSKSFLEHDALDHSALNSAIDTLTSWDGSLSRSLQSVAVHRWLVDHDPEIAARLPTEIELGVSHPDAGGSGDSDPRTRGGVAAIRRLQSRLRKQVPASEGSPLSDSQIIRRLTKSAGDDRRLVVRPVVDPDQIGGTTIDLRLGTEWEVLRTARFQALNPADDSEIVSMLLEQSVEEFRLTSGQNQGLVLHPGELMLALTLEYLQLPADLWGNLEGRSTWARVGLQVHATAGMVDAGFSGYLTLELQNTGRLPLVLYPGLRVGQMAFFPMKDVIRYYSKKSGAAYTNQTRARTAFPLQHEHKALRAFMAAETAAERAVSEIQL